MFSRISVYLNEMYPPGQRLVMAIVLFFAPCFAMQLLGGMAQPVVSWSGIAGFLTYFLFLLTLRISDEFKDYELDCRLFPSRPLPSGRVTKSDLKTLAAASLVALVLLNTLVAPLTMGFAIIMIYCGLMLKFFFIKERIQKSLVLALITHNPVIFLLTVYASYIVSNETKLPPLTLEFLQVGILFALPGLIWELSRKIRAPADENEYETYSQVFGYRMAAANPALLYILHFLMTLNLARQLPLSHVYLIALAIGALAAIAFSIRFVLNPNSKTAQLRPAAEVYSTIASLGFMLDLFIAKGLQWNL
jgi:4-hydroxybenzoate polyprenyltransferase